MKTLGIDLASKAKNTALCAVTWTKGQAVIEALTCPADDEQLLAATKDSEVFAGIDSPFGWPDAFVRSLVDHHAQRAWTTAWCQAAYESHCLRRTDQFVIDKINLRPLSVSSDRIAIPAMRCAWLLGQHGVRDRSGAGRFFEVYPAAALKIWGFTEGKSYKRKSGRGELRALTDRIFERAAGWLKLGPNVDRESFTNDHQLDALVAALNARAAAKRTLTEKAPVDEIVQKEGWIALPLKGSWERLCEE